MNYENSKKLFQPLDFNNIEEFQIIEIKSMVNESYKLSYAINIKDIQFNTGFNTEHAKLVLSILTSIPTGRNENEFVKLYFENESVKVFDNSILLDLYIDIKRISESISVITSYTFNKSMNCKLDNNGIMYVKQLLKDYLNLIDHTIDYNVRYAIMNLSNISFYMKEYDSLYMRVVSAFGSMDNFNRYMHYMSPVEISKHLEDKLNTKVSKEDANDSKELLPKEDIDIPDTVRVENTLEGTNEQLSLFDNKDSEREIQTRTSKITRMVDSWDDKKMRQFLLDFQNNEITKQAIMYKYELTGNYQINKVRNRCCYNLGTNITGHLKKDKTQKPVYKEDVELMKLIIKEEANNKDSEHNPTANKLGKSTMNRDTFRVNGIDNKVRLFTIEERENIVKDYQKYSKGSFMKLDYFTKTDISYNSVDKFVRLCAESIGVDFSSITYGGEILYDSDIVFSRMSKKEILDFIDEYKITNKRELSKKYKMSEVLLREIFKLCLDSQGMKPKVESKYKVPNVERILSNMSLDDKKKFIEKYQEIAIHHLCEEYKEYRVGRATIYKMVDACIEELNLDPDTIKQFSRYGNIKSPTTKKDISKEKKSQNPKKSVRLSQQNVDTSAKQIKQEVLEEIPIKQPDPLPTEPEIPQDDKESSLPNRSNIVVDGSIKKRKDRLMFLKDIQKYNKLEIMLMYLLDEKEIISLRDTICESFHYPISEYELK